MDFYVINEGDNIIDNTIFKVEKPLNNIKQKVKHNQNHICGVCTFTINRGSYERLLSCNHRIHNRCYEIIKNSKGTTIFDCPICYEN